MKYEVELKAWIDDWDAVEGRLHEECLLIREFRKVDRYFSMSGRSERETSFRIRLDNGGAVVTFKDKSLRDRVEFNEEREFTVDDADAFVELVERTGCRQYAAKVKEGLEFRYGGLTVELVRLEGLGEFIEIEVMEESARAEVHERAAARIRSFLDLVGIDPSRIEERSYVSLLGREQIGQDRPSAR